VTAPPRSPTPDPPFYLPSGGLPEQPPPHGGGERPLAENLWTVDAYNQVYLQQLARMLREGFGIDTMYARIVELADLIRPDAYADPHKAFTNAQFETSLTSSIQSGQLTIWGLEQFVSGRFDYLRPLLDAHALPSESASTN
jgi:hypothetical protein